MNNRPKDITGEIFNFFTAIRFVSMNKFRRADWEFRCICGKIIISDSNRVKTGGIKSCGCKKSSLSKDKIRKSLKDCWLAMRSRCTKPTNPNYKNYGGRGINVCKKWQNFDTFMNWALGNGYKKGLTIERINVHKNYTPANCKFIERADQYLNKTNSVFISYNGENKSIAEWSRITGLHSSLIYARKKRGYPSEFIFNKPKHVHLSKLKKVA